MSFTDGMELKALWNETRCLPDRTFVGSDVKDYTRFLKVWVEDYRIAETDLSLLPYMRTRLKELGVLDGV